MITISSLDLDTVTGGAFFPCAQAQNTPASKMSAHDVAWAQRWHCMPTPTAADRRKVEDEIKKIPPTAF